MRTKIWACLSDQTPMGVLLWEIFEVDMEDNNVNPSNFVECRDGSFIMVTCDHFWTQEQARHSISDCDYLDSKYFDYELVGENVRGS